MLCLEWKPVALVSNLPTKYEALLTVSFDIIELGLPFTDPIADGPTIQKANTVRNLSRSHTINCSRYV